MLAAMAVCVLRHHMYKHYATFEMMSLLLIRGRHWLVLMVFIRLHNMK